MYIKTLKNIKGNYIIIAKTTGIFTLKSFEAIKFILDKNKKLYNYLWFKKIPNTINNLFIKNSDIIIELLNYTNIKLQLIKIIASKLSFKIKLIYLKI